MGGCETTPPDSRTGPGTPANTSSTATTTRQLSSLAIIGRRLPASSSFLLAAARLRGLQLDPRPRGGAELAAVRNAQHNSQPRRLPGHRVRTARSLDSEGPMGGWVTDMRADDGAVDRAARNSYSAICTDTWGISDYRALWCDRARRDDRPGRPLRMGRCGPAGRAGGKAVGGRSHHGLRGVMIRRRQARAVLPGRRACREAM
jgi:hypothetical protein